MQLIRMQNCAEMLQTCKLIGWRVCVFIHLFVRFYPVLRLIILTQSGNCKYAFSSSLLCTKDCQTINNFPCLNSLTMLRQTPFHDYCSNWHFIMIIIILLSAQKSCFTMPVYSLLLHLFLFKRLTLQILLVQNCCFFLRRLITILHRNAMVSNITVFVIIIINWTRWQKAITPATMPTHNGVTSVWRNYLWSFEHGSVTSSLPFSVYAAAAAVALSILRRASIYDYVIFFVKMVCKCMRVWKAHSYLVSMQLTVLGSI